MKKQLSRTLLGLAAALALAVAANAQVLSAVVVNVPFDFVVGGKRMPAGRYTVGRLRSDAETALVIRSADGRDHAVVLTSTGEAHPRKAALVFRQRGDTRFLAEVSMPGTASVRELPEADKTDGAKTVTVVGSVR